MKYLVTYMSKSGNTKKIAEAIYSKLPEDSDLKPITEVENLDEYDISFIGFPVMQFGVPKKIQHFMDKHAKNKKVAIFVTHASSPLMKDFDKMLMKCKGVAREAELLGFYNCQGALSKKAIEKMKNHNDPKIRKFAEKGKLTQGHPNEEEIAKASEFAKNILTKN